MKASRRNWLLGVTLLIAAMAVGGFTYFNGNKKTTFLKTKVQRGNVEAAISATGTINAVTSTAVGSQVSGNVLDLYADFNSVVKKGEKVAKIDPAPYQTKVDQAKANLDSANAGILNADVALKTADLNISSAKLNVTNMVAAQHRAESQLKEAQRLLDQKQAMVKSGIGAQTDYDAQKAAYDQAVDSVASAKAAVDTANANLESVTAQRKVAETQKITAESQVVSMKANLENANLDLEHTNIYSPVTGVVISRVVDRGQTVQASMNAPTLFTIAQDLTTMHLETSIDESDISRVQEKQNANFTVDAFPGQTFHGEVIQVRRLPVNVSNVITYTVEVLVENPDLKLFPGMTANVKLITDRQENVLKIPNAAIRFRPPDDVLPADAKQKDKAKDVAKGDGKFDPSQFKGGGGGGGGDRGNGGGGGGGFRNGGGGGGGRGNRGGDFNANQGGGAPRPTSQAQTVYVVDDTGLLLKPVRIRTGISDGNFVSLVSGDLTEGQELVTGIENPKPSQTKAGQNNAPGFNNPQFPGGGNNKGGNNRGFGF
jgi:HlyD family secretion protein